MHDNRAAAGCARPAPATPDPARSEPGPVRRAPAAAPAVGLALSGPPEGPASAPPGERDLRRLSQAVQGLSPFQLHWASGYLAGLAAARLEAQTPHPGRIARPSQPAPSGDPAPTAAPAPAVQAAARLTVLYASQTGNARSVAERVGRRAAAQGLAHRVVSAADFNPRDLARERLLLLVVSTQGEGEPPASALELHRWLTGKRAPDLSRLSYGVFGLGDASYARFCQAGRDFDARLAGLGARRLFPRVDADLDFAQVCDTWLPGAIEQVAAALAAERPAESLAGHPTGPLAREAEIVPLIVPQRQPAQDPAPVPVLHDRDRPYPSEVLDNRPLTTPDAVAEVRHLVLAADPAALPYAPGDSLGVWFRNAPDLVERVLAAAGLEADAPVVLGGGAGGLGGDKNGAGGGTTLSLGRALSERLELTRLHPRVVSAWADLAQSPELTDLAGDSAALRAWCRGRQVPDLFARWPARPSPAELAGLLRPLVPRLYSIASAPAESPDEVHLTVAPLRYTMDGEPRLGGASGCLAERIEPGDTLPVYLAENPAFRLPTDGDMPVILVGAGTGVAPFRAFLKQRAAQGDRGPSWLVLGNRHFHRDFLYQSDWLRLRKAGALTRFSPAFSRDGDAGQGARGPYVQDRLRADGALLWRWLADGARLYVCGATAMETGVRAALTEIARTHGGLDPDGAQAFVEDLRAEGRYLRDVY